MEIENRIRGKNPNRVLGQMKRQLAIQRQRVFVAGFFWTTAIAVLIYHAFAKPLPTTLFIFVIIAVGIASMYLVFDYLLYRNKLADLNAVQEFIDNTPKTVRESVE